MPRLALATCGCVVLGLTLAHAQAPAASRSTPGTRRTQPDAARLPIRRIVLYKNGVGYFEHVGRVRGSDSVSIDFNSGQLDDVLKSLTALDLGNGRVSGISYNSEASVRDRLGAIRLPVGERPTLPELLGALRGARVELRTGDRVVVGRLLGVERRVQGTGEQASPRDEVTIVGDAGTIRRLELTPATTIRLAERDTAEQVGSYLGLLAATRAPDRRRLIIDTVGAGDRDLLVSYISEVPVWKTSYRIVLPPGGEQPLLQAWAIVDNTTAEDWTAVELSLVAGAPQSFIERLSQPQYTRRPVVQPAKGVLLTPQTHDPTLGVASPEGEAAQTATVTGETPVAKGVVGGVVGEILGGLPAAAPPGPPALDRNLVADRVQALQAAAEGRDLADLFEYRLNAPISIRRNQSALVPIANSAVEVERVSLWTGRSGLRPLRALWLTNSTGLTLDAGSFTVLDDGDFAGEGLVEPLKPQEKRLLSYAVDLGVQVESRQGDEHRRISRIVAQRGVVVRHDENRTKRVYTIRNNDAVDREVVVEHPRRPGWSLTAGTKPVETSAAAYRFRLHVGAKRTATLDVEERQEVENRYQIALLTDDQLQVLLRDTRDSPAIGQALQPIVDKKAEAADLLTIITDRYAQVQRAADDEQRIRENLGALKGTSQERRLASRYAAQLTDLETRIDQLRGEIAGLESRRQQALGDVNARIARLAIDITVDP